MKRLTKELIDLLNQPCEGIRVLFNEANVADVQAEIDGPTGTPFQGGLFRLRLSIPMEFPSVPPKGMFLTKIFHPNVSPAGEICVNVLKKDWTPETGIRCVLLPRRYEATMKNDRLLTRMQACPDDHPLPPH